MLYTFEVIFSTDNPFYKKMLSPLLESTKHIIAKNKRDAIDIGLEIMMKDFPDSQKSYWRVKNIIFRGPTLNFQ